MARARKQLVVPSAVIHTQKVRDQSRHPARADPGTRNQPPGPAAAGIAPAGLAFFPHVGALVSPGLNSLPSWNTVRLEP